MTCQETTSSQLGKNQKTSTTQNVDTYVTGQKSALQLVENIGKDLSYLTEHIESMEPKELLLEMVEVHILKVAEELDKKLEIIAEKMDPFQSGEL